jgi:isopenicillin N synthase-like dioxygenase
MSPETLVTAPRIPIVDLTGTVDDARCRAGAARAIGEAAEGTGFFYVANHGVEPALVERAFAQARTFFALSDERKLAARMAPGAIYGYEPLNTETLDAAAGADLKESFRAGFGDADPWPDLPDFRTTLAAYERATCDLAARVVRLLALSLGESEDRLDDAFRPASRRLRLLHYPARPADAPARQIGAGAHTDWGGITILAQDDAGGLEVRDRGGAWVRALPVPGTFVINLGDLLARWTNDRYHSNPHRVFNSSDVRGRHSIALFYGPRDDARIACLPSCVAAGDEPRYAPITAGAYLAARWREAYGVNARG